MHSMFEGATEFNGDLSSWNVSSVTDMDNMFNDVTAFHDNLSSWDVSSITDMYGMFRGATAFSSSDLSRWNVTTVMFCNATVIYADVSPGSAFNGNLLS
jgi:surface protein